MANIIPIADFTFILLRNITSAYKNSIITDIIFIKVNIIADEV